MSAIANLRSSAEAQLAKLSARERLLLVVMVVSLGAIGLLLTLGLTWQKTNELQQEIVAGRGALDALLAQRDTYLEKSRERSKRDEQLKGNALRLSSFIEDAATAATSGRPREFRDAQEPTPGRADITRLRTTVKFQDVTFDQFKTLLEGIAASDELVFIERVSMSSGRGREVSDKLEVEIALLTFKHTSDTKADAK